MEIDDTELARLHALAQDLSKRINEVLGEALRLAPVDKERAIQMLVAAGMQPGQARETVYISLAGPRLCAGRI